MKSTCSNTYSKNNNTQMTTNLAKKIKKTKLNRNKWAKVKIKGNVIAENGVGLEGLIGLEVLENYDAKLVDAAKPKISIKEKHLEPKNIKYKENEDNADSCEKDTKMPARKSKNQTISNKVALKLEKPKKKREQRKLQDRISKEPKKSPSKPKKYSKNDRFKLLRPPPSDTESENEEEAKDNTLDDIPELIESKALTIDDLEEWSSLGVPAIILKALAELGFETPTEIQRLTLAAAIMGKKDILGAAETGSGKTLAFGIPLLAGIMELKKKNSQTGIRKPLHKTAKTDNRKKIEFPLSNEEIVEQCESSNDEEEEETLNNSKPLYAIVLTPTRELAVQVRNHLIAVAKYTGIQVAVVFGGLSLEKQDRLLSKRPEIVVATPGRFWELYQQGHKHLRNLDDISFLVIDETDRMVEKGHFEELRNVLKVLNADDNKKQSRQNFIFSATLTLVHDLPEHMQKRNFGKRPRFIKTTAEMKIQNLIEELGISQPKIVDITTKQQLAHNITECRMVCAMEHKDYYLYYFVQRHPGRTIVFCNSIDCVKRLATLFGLLQCQPLPLHANMIQKQRLKNLERFRDNPCGLLIATDVAARGLDIPNVEHVIHYQVPRTSENYVHRSGRTARANKQGLTVMFMEPGEIKNYVKLYKTLQKTEDLPLFPVNEHYLAAVKERVNLAREVDKEELKLKRIQTEVGWMRKHAEEMDMVIEGYNDHSGSDDDEDPFIIERKRNRMHLLSVRNELKALLSKQIFPKNFSFKYPTATGHLQLPDISGKILNNGENSSQSLSAVKVLQKSVEDIKQAKRLRNKRKRM